MSNWITEVLQYGLQIWNDKTNEIYTLVTQSPAEFRDGHIWEAIVNIHGCIQAIALALLVLFFVIGVMKTCGNLTEVKRPEHALKLFIRFALAKGLITYGLEILMSFFDIVHGISEKIMEAVGFGGGAATSLPNEIVTAIQSCNFFESIPLMAVAIIRIFNNSSSVFFYNFNSVWQIFQNLYLYCYCTNFVFDIWWATNAISRYKLYESILW